MAEENKPKTTKNADTPVEESARKTGSDTETGGKDSAAPESGSNDSVVGSPNQGTESR
jgi:hypothetical protein